MYSAANSNLHKHDEKQKAQALSISSRLLGVVWSHTEAHSIHQECFVLLFSCINIRRRVGVATCFLNTKQELKLVGMQEQSPQETTEYEEAERRRYRYIHLTRHTSQLYLNVHAISSQGALVITVERSHEGAEELLVARSG